MLLFNLIFTICYFLGNVYGSNNTTEAAAKRAAPYPFYTYCSFKLSSGYYTKKEFTDEVSDLRYYNNLNLDNAMYQAKMTGLWIFYENSYYNSFRNGLVLWAHGVDYELLFPQSFLNRASSLRFAGNQYNWNEDSITLYSRKFLSGNELYTAISLSSLGSMRYDAESIVVTGRSYWTLGFYVQQRTIRCCLGSDIRDKDSSSGRTLNFAIVPQLPSYYANSLYQVYKGCYSSSYCAFNSRRSNSMTRQVDDQNPLNGAFSIGNL